MSGLLTPLRVEIAGWLLLCGGLGVGLGLETDWGRQLQPPPPELVLPATPFTGTALKDPYSLPTADTFLDIAMKPVFLATRRPVPAAPPPEPPKPAMQRNQFQLSGVTILPDSKFAFLTEKAGNKSRVVKEGDEINGILVKTIGPDKVVLSQFDETEILTLKTAKGPATTENAGAKKPAEPAAKPPPGGTGERPTRPGRTQPTGGD
jgi:hypothetical protein